jgi:hypothetical protein
MNASRTWSAAFHALTVTVLLNAAASALSAETPATPSEPSKAMREKMATVHQSMAACLRSDRAFAECQQQMHRNCAEMVGQGCSLMGMGSHKKGMMPKQEK